MTFTASGRSRISAGNGAVTAFSTPPFQAGNLFVYLLSADSDPEAAAMGPDDGTLLTEGVDYTLAGDGEAGAAVVTTIATYAAGQYVLRWRQTSLDQVAEYEAGVPLSADATQRTLDRAAMALEEVADDRARLSARALQVPAGSAAPTLQAPIDYAGAALGMSADGSTIVPLTLDGDGVSALATLADPDAGSLEVAFRYDGAAATRTDRAKLTEMPASAADRNISAASAADQSGAFIDMWNRGGGYVPPADSGHDYVVNVNTPLDNLFGGALPRRNGGYVPLPYAAVPFDMARKIMSLFAQVRSGNGTIALLGTSVDEGYDFAAPNGTELDWFTMLRNLFAFVSKSTNEETVTNFGDLARYGLTAAGGSAGIVGPIGKSWIMTPGDTLTFTGDFQFVEVFHETDPAHGKIEFRRNGGAAYKTIDCAAAPASDVSSFPSATCAAGSATHQLKCITANVQITGLMRLNGTVTSTPYFARMALAGSSTTAIYNRTASILRIMASPGASRGCLIVDHGINNYQNTAVHTTVATYKSHMRTIVGAALAAGHLVLLVGPMRPDATLFPPVDDASLFENYLAALADVAREYDVPLIDMDVWDWFAKGWLPAGLHPNIAGAMARKDIFFDALCKLPGLAPARATGADLTDLTPTGNLLLPTGKAVKINGVQVVGPRDTGYTQMTGTAAKGALATYAAGTASGAYVQAELQSVMDALQAVSRRLKAHEDSKFGAGSIGA
jgi:hypothetical protein